MRIIVLILSVVLVGCEYIPTKVHEIETKTGETIRLACPEIDPHRNIFTYMYRDDCQIWIEN